MIAKMRRNPVIGRPGWVALALAGAVVTTLAAAFGCGGGSSTTASPTPTPTPTNPVSTNTITISNNTVSPRSIVVARGSQVTMVNNDSISHDMQSDPHPEHTDCPQLGSIGFLSPGQSRQTGNLTIARVCGYHDHQKPETASLNGTITIQ